MQIQSDNAGPPEFIFAIPFRSKAVSKSWDEVLTRFRWALKSILQQTDGNWKVIVACHEIPDVEEMSDPRIHAIQVKYDPPLFVWEYLPDKAKKRETAACWLRDRGGGYVMFMDDDDLVSNRLVEWVRSQPVRNGFILPKGYEYYTATDTLRYAPHYNRMGGTCSVLKLSTADLPERPLQRERTFLREIVETSHANWDQLFAKRDRPLVEVPFPASIWVRHGDQMSSALGIRGLRRELVRLIYPARPPTKEQRTEFSIWPAPASSDARAS